MVIPISVNGSILKPMAMECTSGRMGIATTENGGCASNMGKAVIYSAMETCTQGNTKRVNFTVEDNTLGKTVRPTWESSKEDSRMVRGSGKAGKGLNATSTKENT
jgi:hypothetical protein